MRTIPICPPLFVFVLSLLVPGFARSAPLAPVGFVEYSPAPQCVDAQRSAAIAEQLRAAGTLSSAPRFNGAALFPLYDWPLEHGLRDGNILVNYVDDDPTAAIKDYQGLPHAYDGHNGTDIALYNFRLMDRGQRVVSGASGVVTQTTWNKFDRNTGPPYSDTENNVIVQNPDGTYTWYLHLRRNSVTVEPGELVTSGTVLGLVGSSGFSTDAHLHFEVGDFFGGPWTKRDPWNGPNNPASSLWNSQLPYVGTDPLWIADIGVSTAAAAGGNLNSVPAAYFKERLSQPAVMGANETFLPVFLQLQGNAGNSYRIEVRRPNGTVYSFVNYTLPSKLSYGWHLWYWGWNGGVPAGDYGLWSTVVKIGTVEVARTEFQVGPTTIFGPRFAPIGGRSFRINGSVQLDALSVSPLGGPVTYSLVGAPSFVTLAGSDVTIGAVSNQPQRSLYFQAIATDADGRTDTMWYHLVDPTKSIDAVPVELSKFEVN